MENPRVVLKNLGHSTDWQTFAKDSEDDAAQSCLRVSFEYFPDLPRGKSDRVIS